jgi:hypothetical protein
MLNEVNTSVCEKVYGMHPFMSFSTAFTISDADAEIISVLADEKLMQGARKPMEEILADAFMLYALESVEDAIDSDMENMTPFTAAIADLVQCLDLMGIGSKTHKTVAYFSEFAEDDLSDIVLVTLMFIPNDAEDIKLK